MSRQSFIVIGILIAILTGGAILTYVIFLSPTGYKAHEDADLTKVLNDEKGLYTNLAGEPLDFEDFRGKPMVVNVWATWSPFSNAEFETLARLKSAFGDNIEIIALDRMESKETANAYLETIGKKEGIEYVIDTNDHFFNSLGGYAMPETIIFDEVGNEHFRKRGVLDYEEAQKALTTLLPE